MSTDENKALVRRTIEEVWNKGSLAGVDELLATDYVGHFAILPEPVRGHTAFKQFASHYFTAFPDIRVTIDDLVADGDKVVVRWTARGTHRGELMGIPPTGKPVTVTGMWIHRVAGGRIAEQWGVFDALGMMQQLGTIPAPGSAGR